MLHAVVGVDVDARAGVADEHAFARVQRRRALEHPAVLAVAPPQAVLDLERLALVERLHAGVEPASEVLRVHGARPALAQRLLGRVTGVFQPCATDLFARHVRPRTPRHQWNVFVGLHATRFPMKRLQHEPCPRVARSKITTRAACVRHVLLTAAR
jgi:hypothetical protein